MWRKILKTLRLDADDGARALSDEVEVWRAPAGNTVRTFSLELERVEVARASEPQFLRRTPKRSEGVRSERRRRMRSSELSLKLPTVPLAKIRLDCGKIYPRNEIIFDARYISFGVDYGPR